jgi:hypothetical protein
MVAEEFSLETYVDMTGVQAFSANVIAYPAITIIARDQGIVTATSVRPDVDGSALSALALRLRRRDENTGDVRLVESALSGSEPWIFDSSDAMSLVRRLEADYPLLEDAGCKVGIGVATGADKAFIGLFDELDVECDRKLPIALTKDIKNGSVEWRGYGVINPFKADGGLVNLAEYPKLRDYLELRRDVISRRHVAKKSPDKWYKTIDRIYPELATRPKLLIPDIKGAAHIVYENEGLYPHHNLYFITSATWDLRCLQAVLMSGVARIFVEAYSTKMHGGFLRFQAQYLRRIRLPDWESVPLTVRNALKSAALEGDVEACNAAISDLYNLSPLEAGVLRGQDDGS